jgi:hypothetical protein
MATQDIIGLHRLRRRSSAHSLRRHIGFRTHHRIHEIGVTPCRKPSKDKPPPKRRVYVKGFSVWRLAGPLRGWSERVETLGVLTRFFADPCLATWLRRRDQKGA